MLPKSLIEAATHRTLVPFVGAGFSMISGLPSWSDLMAGLTDQLDVSTAVREVARELHHPDFAELLDSVTSSERQIVRYLQKRIDDPRVTPGEQHALLCRLDPLTVLTTNWDRLIEAELRRMGRRPTIITDDRSVAEFCFTENTNVLKLHGTIEQQDSLVYQKSQYVRYWEHRPALSSLVKVLFSTQNLLFLGYGLGDPNVSDLLQTVHRDLGRLPREHWRLRFQESELDETWRRLGVTTIDAREYDPNGDYKRATCAFLSDLIDSMREAALTNLERARVVNHELEKQILANRLGATLRMRGSLGWLSNPQPDGALVVYGSPEQDAEEYRMTQLVRDFVQQGNGHSVKCVLSLSGRELLGKYSVEAGCARLQALRSNVIDLAGAIQIVASPQPSGSNEMIFDEDVVVLGYKLAQRPGIGRVIVERDHRVVQRHVAQFEADFAELAESSVLIDASNCTDVVDREIELIRLADARQDEETPESHLLFLDILAFAREAHESAGQTREDGVTPYWIHPVRVALLLKQTLADVPQELVAAALLHDVLEDTATTHEVVMRRFGSTVAKLVEELTAPGDSFDSYLKQLHDASALAQTVKIADRLDNVRELLGCRYPTYGGWTPAEYAAGSRRMREACDRSDGSLLALLDDATAHLERAVLGDGWRTDSTTN